MKARPIIFQIDLHIYPVWVLVAMGATDAEVCRKLTPQQKREEVVWKLDETSAGRAGRFSGGNLVLRLAAAPKEPEDFGMLAHEVFHIATMILEWIGTPLSPGIDEPMAYLIGHITKTIHRNL